MSWTKQDNTILTPGVDLDLWNAIINPIKVDMGSEMPCPVYFSEHLTIDENDAISCTMGSHSYAITFDSNGNLLDFYYRNNAA